jgi:hypothetical protein
VREAVQMPLSLRSLPEPQELEAQAGSLSGRTFDAFGSYSNSDTDNEHRAS